MHHPTSASDTTHPSADLAVLEAPVADA